MKRREELLQDARVAFERGRVAKALRTSALVLPMIAVSFACCGNRSASIALAGALVALVASLAWRGGGAARAVLPGLAAGAVPLAIAVLACPACDHAGASGAWPMAACVVGGVLSGALVARFAMREAARSANGNGATRDDGALAETRRATFLVSAGAVAALTGSLGCVIVGVGGVVAMATGLALIAALGLFPARGAAH